MGAWTKWGVGCCCGGNISGHCDSSAFESSCSDEGQGFPLSFPVGCSLPAGYIPLPGIVASWNGTEWTLETDSSSSDESSSAEPPPPPPPPPGP